MCVRARVCVVYVRVRADQSSKAFTFIDKIRGFSQQPQI